MVDERLDIGADAPLSRLYRPGTQGASASLFILGGIEAVADNRQRAPEDGVFAFPNNAGRFAVGKGQLIPPGGVFMKKDAAAIEHRGANRPGQVEDRRANRPGQVEDRRAQMNAEHRSTVVDEKQREKDAAAAGKVAGQAAYDAAIAAGKTKDDAKAEAQTASKEATAAALATDGGE